MTTNVRLTPLTSTATMPQNITLATRVSRVKPSPTLAVSARAETLQAEGKPIINLSVGEPDFDTPDHIKAAAIAAIREGHTKYTAVDGIKSLKTAVIDKFTRDNHLQYAPNQILVSCGAKQSLYNLFAAVINPGDEVIIPAPYWVSYPDMCLLAEGNPCIVETNAHEQFKLTPEKLAAAITDKSRLLVLNSPSNPTGIAYTKDELSALGEVILKHPHLLVVSDDIYEHNLWHHIPFHNIVNACPRLYDRTIVINGVSKAYAMTGWRIGYAAGPVAIIAAMKKIQSQSTSSPTSISQYAALAALTGDQSCVKKMTDAYHSRYEFVIQALKEMPGVRAMPSDGTFYTFPDISACFNDHITDDLQFADYLLSDAEIAVVPGSAFGCAGHIRISFATSIENLVKAMDRLKQAVHKLKTL